MVVARRVPAHRPDTDAGGYWMSCGQWGVDPEADLPARVEALALMYSAWLLGPGPEHGGCRGWSLRPVPAGYCMSWTGKLFRSDGAQE
jgi:hypothetical protein